MSDLETSLLDWGAKLQLWQRDLLRRLAQGEVLGTADYRAYAEEAKRIEFAKPAPWANTPPSPALPKYVPLDATHLQATASGSPPVCIDKITHLEGANDLAPGATVPFACAGLTIIAGRNGSGKSGYVRILKQAAASRGPEKVLPNAFRPAPVPKAVISYHVGSSAIEDLSWQSGKPLESSPLQRVRVFDAKSAAAQVATSNEVAFVPPTLQVLSDYTSALSAIGAVIEYDRQQAEHRKRSWPDLETGIGAEIFEHLGEKTGLEMLRKMTPLLDEEVTELGEIPDKLKVLTVSDPAKAATQARIRAGQLSTLARNLKMISNGLSDTRVKESVKTHQRVLATQRAVDEASKQIQQNMILPATGSEKWRSMWLAAKKFVEDIPDHEFPDLTDGAVCALCQQPLEFDARERFRCFEEFMKGEAQTELQEAENARRTNIAALKALPIETAVNQDLVNLVTTYDERTGEALLPLIASATTLRNWLVIMENPDNPPEDVVKLEETFRASIASLNKAATEETAAAEQYGSSDSNALEASKLQTREQELKLRQQIAADRADIEGQHDLLVEISCLQAAAKTCETTAASRENTKLSKKYVDKVCASFTSETKMLGLDRVPVELVFDKSARGVSYIRVSLVGAPTISVPTVLSEGEQRIAAIAGFFADLTESGDNSTLVFDDPVCSLDQSYREAVARRLLIEAEKRQVLVFSHDFTFVQYLYEQQGLLKNSAATKQPAGAFANIEYVHIARSQNGAGEPTTAEQWRHVTVGERIKRLNERIQEAEKSYRARDDAAYEKDARDIVGAIRETWECFVEQELLNSVVQRHERAVQTQRLKHLVDINDADIAAVDKGMKISSRWLTGHDAPVSDGTQIIPPDQLREEMDQFIDFRSSVINRRKRK
ncbi:MAG: hypothetical protein KBI40_02255 [Firmicutes bacterium]|jgi:energy-coupling factor transporter ATP-binding protein EcfA2|nr:hypothetical protein [Candidatus Fermentithermobacillaceae bacterium]